MKRQQIIERLETTVHHLKKLPDEKFNFEVIINNMKSGEPTCDTVGCVMGWYPSFYGNQSPVFWEGKESLVINENLFNRSWNNATDEDDAMMEYHGIKRNLVTLLFYAVDNHESVPIEVKNRIGNFYLSSSRDRVVEVWEIVIDYIKNTNLLDHLLILD